MANSVRARPFEGSDLEAAAEYLAARHRLCRERFPILPARFEDAGNCAAQIRSMMNFATGLSAVDATGQLAGFMFAIRNIPSPTSGSARFAAERGSMMFAHGHAVAPGVEPYPVYNALFGALAEQYTADGIFDHTAHVPAGDGVLDDAWANLGFGRNAAVAARSTAPLEDAAAPGITVGQATPDDLDAIYRIAATGNAHHALPPMFTPYVEGNTEEDVRASLRRGLASEDQAMFLAFEEREPVGLLWIQPPKGSPLFTPDDACYIGDTAVLPEARGSGLGTAMLAQALAWARDHGYAHVTLHFATANPVSSSFWKGHGFQPVMFHMRRRLDERIAWAQPPSSTFR